MLTLLCHFKVTLALRAAAEATGKVTVVESAAVYRLEQGGIEEDNDTGSPSDEVTPNNSSTFHGPSWAVSYKKLHHRLDFPEPTSLCSRDSRQGNIDHCAQSSSRCDEVDEKGPSEPPALGAISAPVVVLACGAQTSSVASRIVPSSTVQSSLGNASQPLPLVYHRQPPSKGSSRSSTRSNTVALPVVPVIGQMFRTNQAPSGTLKHIVCSSESEFHWNRHPPTSPPCVTHLRQGGSSLSSLHGKVVDYEASSSGGMNQDQKGDVDQRWTPRLTRHLYGRQTSDGRLIWGGDRRVSLHERLTLISIKVNGKATTSIPARGISSLLMCEFIIQSAPRHMP